MEINKMLIFFFLIQIPCSKEICYLFVCLSRRLAKLLVDLERQVFQFRQSVVRFVLLCFLKTLLNLYLLDCLPEMTLASLPASDFTCVCQQRQKREGHLFFL